MRKKANMEIRTYAKQQEVRLWEIADGEVGVLPYLAERFHLRAEDIAAKVRETVQRKGK